MSGFERRGPRATNSSVPGLGSPAPTCVLLDVLAKKILALSPPVEIYEVMGWVEKLLDDSVAAEAYIIHDRDDDLTDLTRIDFEALRRRFEQGKKHIEAEKLKGKVRRKLVQLVRLNRSRIDFMERFQQMIDAYNAGSLNIEEFFRRLTEFAQELTEEEKRGIRQALSEEELAHFDLLTKPEMSLTRAERQQVKKAARDLLETLKREELVLDWRNCQQTRAQVRVTIEEALDRVLPRAYTPEIYQHKCDAIYQHVFESYYGAGQSVYAAVG